MPAPVIVRNASYVTVVTAGTFRSEIPLYIFEGLVMLTPAISQVFFPPSKCDQWELNGKSCMSRGSMNSMGSQWEIRRESR